jgi:hypothetical protein
MRISYEKLKKVAPRVRAELAEKGAIDPGRAKTRKRPREKEKLKMLYTMALNRVEKYRPCVDADGKIELPYFQ